ncbi:hypothetical protein [Enterococcus crotali]|uniref:hypothetical protein n=1 Tax=Enterococcus crotali TaxID=1453587 RepID=UPI000471D529|nr:hypothetical protein [Enterococcus crotali]
MYYYRITKYNPKYIKEEYIKNEWTSVSDIGTEFQNHKFTYEEYLEYENSYVNKIIEIMKLNQITNLKVIDLEKYSYEELDYLTSKELFDFLEEGVNISLGKLAPVIRLVLRENIWAKLIGESDIFVHFGYDYYMYCSSKTKVIQKNVSSQLYVEVMKSPYLE